MAVSSQQIVEFLLANPSMSDAEIASVMDQFGVSPADVAKATGVSEESVQSRYESAVQEPAYTPPPEPVYTPPSAPVEVAAPVYTAPEPVYTPPSRGAKLELEPENLDVQESTPAPTGIASLAPAKETPKDTKAAAADKLTQQILAQGTTSQWKGEGFGSAEKNAADMAKILADTGITDISQFGKITKTVDEEVRSDGAGGFVDARGNPVDASKVNQQVQSGEAGDTVFYTAPVGKQEVFGNKATGQTVADTYGERQTGNAFGGTYTGEGNTGYRVQFDASGNPIFYTTKASSSDVGDLAPILAIASFIPALAPFAQAINAAIAIDRGDILGGIASLAGVAGMSEVSTGLKVVKALDEGNIMGVVTSLLADPELGKLASTTMIGDGISFADAGNTLKIVDNLNKGNLTGALTTAADMSGSSDAKTAVAGANLLNAFQSGDMTKIAAAASGLNTTLSATNNVVTQLQDAGLVEKGTNNNIQTLLDGMTTVDASGAKDINAAATFASDSGYNKFTFDGKTYTLNNDNATNTIAQLESDAAKTNATNLAATTKTNLAGGEFDGVDAQVAATAKANNTVIGNNEANDLTEAMALAKARNPTGASFTFGGQTYTMGTSDAAVNAALAATKKETALNDIQNASTFNDAYASAREVLGPNQTFTWNGKQYSTQSATEAEQAAQAKIDALNAKNLSTQTAASSTVAAQNDQAARDAAAKDTAARVSAANVLASNKGGTDYWGDGTTTDAMGNVQLGDKGAGTPNTLLGKIVDKGSTVTGNIIKQGLSNLQQAGGQTLEFVGGTLAATGLAKYDNILNTAGQATTKMGETLQLQSVNEANQNVINAINKADGLGAKIWEGAKAIIESNGRSYELN